AWRLETESHAHDHGVGREVAVADRGREVVDRRVPVEVRDLLQLRLGQVGEAEAMHPVELLFQQVAALGDVLLAPLTLEPLADPLLRRRALDEVQPVAAGAWGAVGWVELLD